MRKILRDHGLLLANLAFFVVFLVAMSLAGNHAYNADQLAHHQSTVSFWRYLMTGDFVEAVFENWESEFLQMGMYVVLTALLFQRGSSESKPVEGEAPQDADPRDADLRRPVPWPVRQGGLVLKLYENSLSILLFVLFFLSIWAHAAGGARAYSEEQLAHGESPVSTWGYVHTAQFWFESFQNWQSEFLAVAVLVGASVYLRQRGSAESKPVAEPHTATGA
jgi:uncharacterized protein DUF6766